MYYVENGVIYMQLMIGSKSKLKYLFETAKRFSVDDNSKIVLMSDLHRGDGGRGDTFIKNQLIYSAALTRYDKDGYTYFELGDGDELWKNRKAEDIISAHKDVFWRLGRMHRQGRLVMLFGNHDITKRRRHFIYRNFSFYFDPLTKKHTSLFGDMPVYESAVLEYGDHEIMLMHGHQVDVMNNEGWSIARFLLRYVWRPLEAFGISDPTSAAVNFQKKISTEKKLQNWTQQSEAMLITGHTHRPMFPSVGYTRYFNCGSGVHPRCVSAIEIKNGEIKLVKWSVKTRPDGAMFVGRDVLAGPNKIEDYYK
jgi:UDP-2,3-diacylglucosamine pyrophosphatase LpxH